MSRFKATWNLVRQSFTVLMQEKKLLFFPLVTSFLTVFIGLFFIAPVALQPTGQSYLDVDHWVAVSESIFQVESSPGASALDAGDDGVELTNWFLGYLTAMYLASMFLLTFFNTAFFNEIIHALNGRPVSILGGLRFALTKLKPIFMWSLLAGIVGILIQKLEQQFGVFGQWIVGLIGVVWSVASVFAVPVLIRDEASANPFDVLRKSALLIKERWGEGLIGYVGIRAFGAGLVLVFTILLLVLGTLGFLAAVSIWPQMPTSALISATVMLLGVWLLSTCLVVYFQNVVNKVFQCALYIYAAEGVIPGPYDEALLDAAWKVKKQKTN